MIVLLVIIQFFCGSLMFSYWLGRMVKKNIRTVGDGNPGAANLWKAAGYKLGLAGVVFDFAKGYIPLFVLIEGGWVTGYELVPITLAPILGHAFSPFLKFKGGKAIAVTFGVWSALTRFEVSVAYAIILAVFLVVTLMINKGKSQSDEVDSFHTVFGFALLSIYLYVTVFAVEIFWIWLGNLLILLYTNRSYLLTLLRSRVHKDKQDHDYKV